MSINVIADPHTLRRLSRQAEKHFKHLQEAIILEERATSKLLINAMKEIEQKVLTVLEDVIERVEEMEPVNLEEVRDLVEILKKD